MTATPPDGNASPTPPARSGSELAKRVASAVVLAPIVLAVAWYGGMPFIIGALALGLGIFIEWAGMAGVARAPANLVLALSAIAAVVVLVAAGEPGYAMLILAVIAAASVTLHFQGDRHRWTAWGILYAAAIAISLIVLRGDPDFGRIAVFWLFFVVWATDVMAYFAGRAIGGPKLWPAVSPKKTWSGAVGGLIGAMVFGSLVAWWFGLATLVPLVFVAAVLSAVSQAGDLFESAIKRHFGVKDSSHLIPGHGGLMDRVDGLAAAAIAAAVIGVLRAGFDSAGQGVLSW